MPIALALALALSWTEPKDGWRDLAGQPCPPIEAEEWLNTGEEKPSTETLHGKPWLLVFFATWEPACMRRLDELSQLHAKYAPLGFRVVLISGEAPATLRKHLVEERKSTVWIGSDPRAVTIKGFADGEVLIPHVFLVGPDGSILAEEVPSEGRVRQLLWKQFELDLRELRPELEKAVTAYEWESYGVAWKEAGKLTGHAEEAVAADARHLREHVEALASFWRGFLEIDLAGPSTIGSYADLLIFEHRFAGLEVARWAGERRASLAGDSDIQREKDAWKVFDKAVRKEMEAVGERLKLNRAIQDYEKLAKAHPRTFPGRLAKQAAARLAQE